MKLRLAAALVAGIAVASVEGHTQTVIDFESFPTCDNSRPNMFVYSGIDFLGRWTCYSYAEAPYAAKSGTNRLYAVNGPFNHNVGRFTFAAQSFVGAWFSGIGTDVFFRLYNGGNLVHTSSSLTTSGTPGYLGSGYSGAVDAVEVEGGNVGWVMDDVMLGATVTPEPATLLLVGTGVAGIGAARRRRRQQS